VGDAQADRRYHGGPDKALHQYPVAHYAQLAKAFPAAADLLRPGSMGENLSVPGWDEANVCIGDSYRLGAAVIQISQPRAPCWKIDHRYQAEGMAKFIDDTGLPGWYFRVLEEGSVEPGCVFELIDRLSPAITLQALLATWCLHRPAPQELQRLAATPGLAENWSRKLHDRAELLKQYD